MRLCNFLYTNTSLRLGGSLGKTASSTQLEPLKSCGSCVFSSKRRGFNLNREESQKLKSREVKNKQVILHTDGSCWPNPGPGGWAYVLTGLDGNQQEDSAGMRLTTNNRMELLAVIHGLEACKAVGVTVVSDSRYVVGGTGKPLGRWHARNTDLWRQLLELAEKHKARFRWVRGHAGVLENERCDALALEARLHGATRVDAAFEKSERAVQLKAPCAFVVVKEHEVKKHSVEITPEVRDILEHCTCAGHVLLLPMRKLPRPLYESVNKVLRAFGGKWNREARGHVFAGAAEVLLAEALSGDSVVDQKKALQQFFTSPELAARMVEQAEIAPSMSVLEPSAGDGAIADEVAKVPGVDLHCMELDPKLCKTLRAKGYETWEGDFLEAPARRQFDRVVMNPPFENHQDIQHVEHAYSLLKPGGRLVSIMSPAFTFQTTRAPAAFRKLAERLGRWEELPVGSFKDSGTRVQTVLVVLDRELADVFAWL